MTIPKKYFQDRVVLLLLTVNVFLAVLESLWVLLRISSGRSEGFIVQYRSNLGISAFKTGSASDLASFAGFVMVVLVINTILSMRMYHQHRQYAVTILSFGVLLMVLAIIVSNALLTIH